MRYNIYMTTDYPKYKDVRAKYKIENEDFEVKIADNLFSESEYATIYKVWDNTPEEKTVVRDWSGHKIFWTTLPKNIEDIIVKSAESIIGEELILTEYSLARYSEEFGYKRKLFPHYDNRPSQRVTFDIQLKADEPWAVVVEGIPYYLKDNQALVFTGTQQMHWRENKELKPSSKTDMIFCHLAYKNDRPLQDDYLDAMEERSGVLLRETNISNEVEKLDTHA
jgi:hypothetical protein